jgi:D-arabinose 1-dehydrogenase-like Zn-dependent alcohol dehydrogenase
MTEIRAFAIRNKGGMAEPFVYGCEIGRHDAMVRITHRSITRGDIQFIENDWGDTRFPLVPSHEMVGIVEQIGSDVTEVGQGDRVGIGFQLGSCFECDYCRQGREQFCPDQTVVGVNAYGGLAEKIVVDARFAFPLPKVLESASATPLMSSGLTVYAAICDDHMPSCAHVAVLGIGGLGRLALQFLRAMGHSVVAFSHSPEKREMIERAGAQYIDSSDPTCLAKYRGTFDSILSTLNVPFDLDGHLRMLKAEGQFSFVATPLEPLSFRAGLLYDYARRRIYGNYVGSRSDTFRMLEFAASHGITAAVDIMPFSQVSEAIERVRTRSLSNAVVLESSA